jgi:hypothetical protein
VTTTTLTTAEKIKAIESSGFKLAYDGCHKIYFIQNEGDVAHAIDCGYEQADIYPASKIRDLIEGSCGLVFASKLGRDNGDFDHPWNIDQGTEDIYAAAEEDA